MDQKELYKELEQGHTFTKELKDTLLTLDTTPSIATQAYLNDLLLLYQGRLMAGEEIIDEESHNVVTLSDFESWIDDAFTTYSSEMYRNTSKK